MVSGVDAVHKSAYTGAVIYDAAGNVLGDDAAAAAAVVYDQAGDGGGAQFYDAASGGDIISPASR